MMVKRNNIQEENELKSKNLVKSSHLKHSIGELVHANCLFVCLHFARFQSMKVFCIDKNML